MNDDIQVFIDMIQQLIQDDPKRLDESRIETQWLFDQDAGFGNTHEMILAETCIYRFKEANAHLADIVERMDAIDDELTTALAAHFKEHNAWDCTDYYVNGSCIHPNHK